MAAADAGLETAATAVFKALDVDENGRVDILEFLAFSKKLFEGKDLREDMLKSTKDILELGDLDGDERLSLAEWVQLIKAWDYEKKSEFLAECRAEALQRNAQSMTPNETLLEFEREAISKEVFNTLDVDHTGTVDFTEITLLVKMLDLTDVHTMMHQLDLDHDGVVSLHEWQTVMVNNTHIDHAQFFEQMRNYKKKLQVIRVDFLRQKAAEAKTIDTDLELADQVTEFLKLNDCGLSFAVRNSGEGRVLVTFSLPTPSNPVPRVGGVVLRCFRACGVHI